MEVVRSVSPRTCRPTTLTSPREVIDFASRSITVNEQPARLTPIVYTLLCYLVVKANTVFTHGAILEKVWSGKEYTDSPEYLKVHIQRPRNKLEVDSANPQLLVGQQRVGYKFVRPPSAWLPAIASSVKHIYLYLPNFLPSRLPFLPVYLPCLVKIMSVLG